MRTSPTFNLPFLLTLAAMITSSTIGAGDPTASEPTKMSVYRVWPGEPPSWDTPSEPERDTTGEDGRVVAGEPVVRLGFVRTPQLHIYHAAPDRETGNVVVICPGGGYSILAWDLEGTEIAKRFQAIGVTAAVLKYRVPTRAAEESWLAPVQDIQRSVSIIRSGGIDGLEPARVGVLGFSAGGNAAVRAATAPKRHYEAIDSHDRTDMRPDFGILVYPAWLVRDDDPTELIDGVTVDEKTPPMFFAHARDDRVSCMSSVTMFSALHRHGVPAAVHVFSGGGHGFGARPTGQEHDHWPRLCESWLREQGWLDR